VSGRTSIGCEVTLAAGARADHVLFGEGPSRIVVSVEPERAREFEALMAESAIPWRWIGTTGGERLVIRTSGGAAVNVGLGEIDSAWRSGFERHMA
jgi:phosphoribosylformylglycinamidine synthase